MRNLRKIRAQKRWSLQDLAELSGVTVNAISRIERGLRRPQPITLAKLADALGVEVEEIEGEERAPELGPDILKIDPAGLSERGKEKLKERLKEEIGRVTTNLSAADLNEPDELIRHMDLIDRYREVRASLEAVERSLQKA